MPHLETEIQRSRRNFIKIGSVATAAILARTQRAEAECLAQSACCFLKSTLIRTAEGDRKIEDLAAGDWLPTVFGGTCPIQSIERYTIRKNNSTGAWDKGALPVRITRSALGPDVPRTDLYVTQAHALLVDGVLVTAGSLINGMTIMLYDARELDELEFFHIKLARHDVIYAAGAPCETLLDVDEPCAPWLSFNGGRSEIRSRFRSAISPWIDRRQPLDIIRDKLEERGLALSREPERML
jgi:hypothetical protein